MTTQKFCQGDLMFERLGEGHTELILAHLENRDGRVTVDLDVELHDGKIVLERGEKTGHAHVVENDGVAVVKVTDQRASYGDPLASLFGAEVIVIANKDGATITHENIGGKKIPFDKLHEPLDLETGVYLIRRQEEFDYSKRETAPRALVD